MRRHIITLSVLIACILGFSLGAHAKKKTSGGEARITFAEKIYDFGLIKEKDGPVTHSFEFTNAGDANLVILKATAECGCTRPQFPANPIAPGKKGSLKVTFNPAGREGGFEKVVTVTTNGNPRKIRLKIRGTITPK